MCEERRVLAAIICLSLSLRFVWCFRKNGGEQCSAVPRYYRVGKLEIERLVDDTSTPSLPLALCVYTTPAPQLA